MRRCTIFVFVFLVSFPLAAQTPAAAPAKPVEQKLSGEALWKVLLTGNLKYQGGEIDYDNLKNERTALVRSQKPPVAILACADSRVPPELLFNQSLGALFVVRTAGNVADELGLASLEYAIKQDWGTRLIVVLGHENCGAVGSALERGDPVTPPLLALVNRIRASFVAMGWNGDGGDVDLRKAIEANARASAAWLTANSAVVRDAVAHEKEDKRVTIIPAYYELGSGAVTKIE
ncbi:MAG TPA: carbonic anhydrase [Thermoanaerobaculia bacterium]|nr:carbonic anhydrase [Thermoanaerobaculia bacterium]